MEIGERHNSRGMILIASANAKLRRQWSRPLKARWPTHEVASRTDLEKSIANQRPSFLLLDLSLPQLGGVGSIPDLQSLCPSTKIILLTNAPDDGEAISALKAGVKGYCNKDIDHTLLAKAMEVVQKGEIWVARKVIPRFLEELTSLAERQRKKTSQKGDVNLDCLTRREHQIASLIGEGSNNKEIASCLGISERTVKTHLTAIFRKIGISDRFRLALLMTNYQQNKHKDSGKKTSSND